MTPTPPSGHAATRTILVTDSGLGGLSVFNDIALRLERGSPWRSVRLVYFNAWPAPDKGYNHYGTKEKRVRVFDNALNAMAKFDPDLMLIACNTLSVIYPHTRFSGSTHIQVQGIVDHGIQMIHENLIADPDSRTVLLGTPTTIDTRCHESGLIRLGIARERIVTVRCTDLAGWIERAPFAETVHQLIRKYVKAAGEKLGDFRGRVYAALCCTHFGYRLALFEQAFARWTGAKVTILNPNVRMARKMFEEIDERPARRTRVEMQIVSKAVWGTEQLAACLKLLPQISGAVRDALIGYRVDDHLFSVDDQGVADPGM